MSSEGAGTLSPGEPWLPPMTIYEIQLDEHLRDPLDHSPAYRCKDVSPSGKVCVRAHDHLARSPLHRAVIVVGNEADRRPIDVVWATT